MGVLALLLRFSPILAFSRDKSALNKNFSFTMFISKFLCTRRVFYYTDGGKNQKNCFFWWIFPFFLRKSENFLASPLPDPEKSGSTQPKSGKYGAPIPPLRACALSRRPPAACAGRRRGPSVVAAWRPAPADRAFIYKVPTIFLTHIFIESVNYIIYLRMRIY